MKENLNSHNSPFADENVQFYETLIQVQPWLNDAMSICAVPLRLTQALTNELLQDFVPNADVDKFRQQPKEIGWMVQRDKEDWQLDRKARRYFLKKLEQRDPVRAQKIHAKLLDHLGTPTYPTSDQDHARLWRAYHTTPINQNEGANLYWSTYCRIRVTNRSAMLPVLADLAESQTHWLTNHRQNIKLYRAAALYYEGLDESKQQAAKLLGDILKPNPSPPIVIDAGFLLGTLKEQTDRNEASKLYRQAINQKDYLKSTSQEQDVQHHLRLTLAKSFFNLASILQTRGEPKALEEAERYYKDGIEIVSQVEPTPAYEVTQLRHLIGVLQKRGEKDKAEDLSQRISQIEEPFRRASLTEALTGFQESGDIGELYYAISALNHGLGYDSQLVKIDVAQDGSTCLKGTYTLRATSVLSQIDFYIETVPESQAGVHFQNLESLTPAFTLDFRRLISDNLKSERIAIIIDPPMQPGDQLTYRWTARSDPGTVATTHQQLKEAKLDHEYAYWDVVVPMKQLEIQVTIPAVQTQPSPPNWVELWRIGQWRATTQIQTAYLALLEDDPGRVRLHTETIAPNKLQLGLKANYPWLAMRYILAWKIPA